MKNKPYYVPSGLSTTGYSGGSPAEFDTFQDVETDHGGFEARGGMVLLTKIADARTIMDFDATDDSVDLVPAPLFGGLRWTLETLFVTDSIASSRRVLGSTGATCGLQILHNTSSEVIVTVRDSANTTTLLTWTGIAAGVVCGLQVVRDGASLTGWLNGTTQTGTMSATLGLETSACSLGVNNGSVWYDGGIDYFRGWNVARSTRQDIYRRLQNPRNPNVAFDYVLTEGTAGTPDVHDRSVYGLHAAVNGTPAWNRTPLSNAAPIQGLAYSVRKNGTRELAIMSAGRPYTASVS